MSTNEEKTSRNICAAPLLLRRTHGVTAGSPQLPFRNHHPRGVTRSAFLSLSLVPVKKCVTLKFDTTRQLLGDSAGEDKSWSGNDAQNNGARHRRLRDPRRKGDHGLEDTHHISEAGQVSQGPTARDWCTHAKTKRHALIFHSGRGTYGPEELDLILSFSTFSHGCKGARSAASAGSAPLWILAYS